MLSTPEVRELVRGQKAPASNSSGITLQQLGAREASKAMLGSLMLGREQCWTSLQPVGCGVPRHITQNAAAT